MAVNAPVTDEIANAHEFVDVINSADTMPTDPSITHLNASNGHVFDVESSDRIYVATNAIATDVTEYELTPYTTLIDRSSPVAGFMGATMLGLIRVTGHDVEQEVFTRGWGLPMREGDFALLAARVDNTGTRLAFTVTDPVESKILMRGLPRLTPRS